MDDNKPRTWKINFYVNGRGEKLVDDFINEQDEPTHAKILSAIMSLKTGGPFLMPPFIKKLQNNLYELRISGKAAIRIFYTLHNGEYYLLHAFKKKTQKTPSQEIRLAVGRIREILLEDI